MGRVACLLLVFLPSVGCGSGTAATGVGGGVGDAGSESGLDKDAGYSTDGGGVGGASGALLDAGPDTGSFASAGAAGFGEDAGEDADAADSGGANDLDADFADAGNEADGASGAGGQLADAGGEADGASGAGGQLADAGVEADGASGAGGQLADAGVEADGASGAGGTFADAGDEVGGAGGQSVDAGEDADSSAGAGGTVGGLDAAAYDADTGTTGGKPDAGGPGHVAYRTNGGPVFLVEAAVGAMPWNLSQALDALSPGTDGDVNLSPDGAWLSIVTTRFGCEAYACAVVIDVGLNQPMVVETAGGQRAHPEASVAVGSGGDVVVFADGGSGHQRDLFVARRVGGAWSLPVNITGASTSLYNTQPAISDDGTTVLFDCGPLPYGASGTKICEVGTDGSGLRLVVDPTNSPNGQSGDRAHSGDYGPDGSIVFEAEWGGENIWRLAPGETVPSLVGSFNNDNTPCVLPDGRVASLWLGAATNASGLHELKVMSADGSNYAMLLQGIDVLDTTLGCGW